MAIPTKNFGTPSTRTVGWIQKS